MFPHLGKAHVWICVIHPFRNGNGRTARLFADAVLIEAGHPPLCFPSLAASMVVPGYADRTLTLGDSLSRGCAGLLHTYEILLGRG